MLESVINKYRIEIDLNNATTGSDLSDHIISKITRMISQSSAAGMCGHHRLGGKVYHIIKGCIGSG